MPDKKERWQRSLFSNAVKQKITFHSRGQFFPYHRTIRIRITFSNNCSCFICPYKRACCDIIKDATLRPDPSCYTLDF